MAVVADIELLQTEIFQLTIGKAEDARRNADPRCGWRRCVACRRQAAFFQARGSVTTDARTTVVQDTWREVGVQKYGAHPEGLISFGFSRLIEARVVVADDKFQPPAQSPFRYRCWHCNNGRNDRHHRHLIGDQQPGHSELAGAWFCPCYSNLTARLSGR